MGRIVALIVVMLVCVPVVALAGSAYITPVYTNTESPNNIETDIHVTNISNITQTVSITLTNMDGTAWANQPLTVFNGNTNPISVTTDGNGIVSATVQPGATLSVSVIPTLSGWRLGHGLISGNNVGYGTLIADVMLYGQANNRPYQASFPINGGNPF